MDEAVRNLSALGLPDWLVSGSVVGAALLGGFLAYRLLHGLLVRITRERGPYLPSLVARLRRPLRLGLLAAALAVAAALAPLGRNGIDVARHVVLVAVIVIIAWVLRVALATWIDLHLRRFRLDSDDNLLARKHVTQSRILQRVVNVVILVVAAGAVLMTFDAVRQYGVSLLASAGAAGIVVGLALQPVLKNLFAGIQLALTQPIRIGDFLIVEGEAGTVEEITASYVVVKLWDWRRLIVPLSHFIEKPFQNWTRESASLIGSLQLYLDHSADVSLIRAKGQELVRASPLWDGSVYACQLTDVRERVIELRIIASAASAGRAFDLRAELREKLIAFIRAEMPQALPRTREEVIAGPDAWVERKGPGRAGLQP